MSIQSRLQGFSNGGPAVDRYPDPPSYDELSEFIAPDELYPFPVDQVDGIEELRREIRDISSSPTTQLRNGRDYWATTSVMGTKKSHPRQPSTTLALHTTVSILELSIAKSQTRIVTPSVAKKITRSPSIIGGDKLSSGRCLMG